MEAIRHILFLSAWYPNRFDPMAGLFVQRHAETISKSFNITVLYTHATDAVRKYEIETSTENELSVVRVYYPKVRLNVPVIGLTIKCWRLFQAHRRGFQEVRKHKSLPDMVHVNILTRVGLFAIYLKIRYDIPYVITEHWSRYLPERNEFKGLLRKIATKMIVHYSAAISTVTERLKNAMISCGITHKRFLIVRNVVDTDLFSLSIQAMSDPKKLVFSHISCFDNDAKNTNGIVRTIAALSKQRKDFVCYMVGDGPDKLEAEHLAQQLGISNDNIRFTGLLEGNNIAEIYNLSLFTLLFSNYETMAVVIPESFACGKPVIATKVGGIPEIVSDFNGVLISPGNENELCVAINDMLKNYTKFDPDKIQQYAVEEFGKEAVLKQFQKLYEVALSPISNN